MCTFSSPKRALKSRNSCSVSCWPRTTMTMCSRNAWYSVRNVASSRLRTSIPVSSAPIFGDALRISSMMVAPPAKTISQRARSRSFRLYAGNADHLAPFVDLALQVSAHLLGRARIRIEAEPRKTRDQVRARGCACDLAAQLQHQPAGRFRRRDDAVPGNDFEARIAFGEGRRVGDQRRA